MKVTGLKHPVVGNGQSGKPENKTREKGISRREFLEILGVGLGSACILGAINTTAVSASATSQKRAILYDSTKCIGCHTCEKACKLLNKLQGNVTTDGDLSADTWLKVQITDVNLSGGVTATIQKRMACMHCGTCVKVCPAEALTQRDDGIVRVDPSKCIGCHYCHEACPYDIPRYGSDGTMGKCSMCSGRVDMGKEPACVAVCPVKALTFGYHDNIAEKGRELVRALIKQGYNDAYLYGDNELGGIPLMYVLAYSPKVYSFPDVPAKSPPPIDLWKPMGLVLGLGLVAAGGLKYFSDKRTKDKGTQPPES